MTSSLFILQYFRICSELAIEISVQYLFTLFKLLSLFSKSKEPEWRKIFRLKRWCNRNTARETQSRPLQTVWWKYSRRWGYWKWNKRWRFGNKCDFRARNHVFSPTPFYIQTSITISILQRMLQLSQTDVTATSVISAPGTTGSRLLHSTSRLHSSIITTTLWVSDRHE